MRITALRLTGVAALVTLLNASQVAGHDLDFLLDRETVGVVRLDLRRVDPAGMARRWFGPSCADPAIAEAVREVADCLDGLKKVGVHELYAVQSRTDRSNLPLVAVVVPPGRNKDEVAQAMSRRVARLFVETHNARRERRERDRGFQQDRMIGPLWVIGPEVAINRIFERRPEPRPDLLAGLAEAPADAAVIFVADQMPALGAGVAGRAARLDELNARVSLVAASLRANDPGQVDLTIRAKDPAGATALADRLRDEQARSMLAPGLARVRLETRGDRVIAQADLMLNSWSRDLIDFLQASHATREENLSSHSIRLLALALWNHEASNGALPAEYISDRQGLPLLSWRVALLPFLDGFGSTDASDLYEKFHRDEPWNSPHNRALIPLMPAVFASRRQTAEQVREGRTVFLAPRGVNTLFPGGRMVQTAEITDPRETLITLIEADPAAAVIWTKPQDWEVEARPVPVGRVGLLLFGDGAVTPVRPDLAADLWRSATTKAGGEIIAESALWTPPR